MGVVEVTFSQPLQTIPPIVDLTKLTFNDKRNLGESKPVFVVAVEPSSLQDPANVELTWEITEFTSTKMLLQIYFEFAKHISFNSPDTLVVEFADPDLFISDGGIQMLPDHRRMTRELMTQLPQDAIGTQTNINSSADDSKKATTAIMASNFLMGFGLKSVIDMINALQIIILLPLIDVKIPANAGMFFKTLAEYAAFDFVDIGEYADAIFKLEPTEPINTSAESLGIDTTYFVNNLGTFYVFLLINFLMLFAWFLVGLLRNCKERKSLKKIERKLKRNLFWNGTTMTVRESFMMVVLCAFISLSYNFSFTSLGMNWQSISVMVLLTIYIV